MKLFFTKVLIFLLFIGNAYSQIVTPLVANLSIKQPNSIFLSDYADPNQDFLNLNVLFQDFNESSWNIYFRVTIEGNNIKLQSKPNFKPNAPVVVQVGTPETFGQETLSAYFSLANLDIQGQTQSLAQNGKLPEGFYSFCVEVLDFNSGKRISNKACFTTEIKHKDPPLPLQPQCEGALITQTNPQTILFTWQDFASFSANSEYQLKLYELTDLAANPVTAIPSGKALPIYSSDLLSERLLLYSNSEPALDQGKTYLYTIQANEPVGRTTYKNNGLSKVCWFYFGYPINNRIGLSEPLNNATIPNNYYPTFTWGGLQKSVQGQVVMYELRVVEILENQSPEDAMANNEVWFQRNANSINGQGASLLADLLPEKGKRYAWQIIATTNTTEVGRSNVQTFNGPPIIDKFYAGLHTVTITHLEITDLQNLSGQGVFSMGKYDTVLVDFSNIRLKKVAGNYVLEKGEILKQLSSNERIRVPLSPVLAQNNMAFAYIDQLRLGVEGLNVRANVAWGFLHLSQTGTLDTVFTRADWFNFNTFKLNGLAKLDAPFHRELLDPNLFILELDKYTEFLLSENTYEASFSGFVEVPKSLLIVKEKPVRFPFSLAPDLLYIIGKEQPEAIQLAKTTNIYLLPKKFEIDLSETKSPTANADMLWKGISVLNYDLDYKTLVDAQHQIIFSKEIRDNFSVSGNRFFYDYKGLTFLQKDTFVISEASYFNSFPAKLNAFQIDIIGNVFNEGLLKGGIVLPFLNEKTVFAFEANLGENGFSQGYLTDIQNKSYTFNPNAGQQEMTLAIKTAVFENQEKLRIAMDVTWPYIGLNLTNITNFYAFGTYEIGFDTPNGTYTLPEVVQSKLETFDIDIDFIGAGSNNGLYGIGTSAKINLGDDVAGGKEAPQVNLYSLMPSSFISGSFSILAQNNNQTNTTAFAPDWSRDKFDVKISDLKKTESSIKEVFKGVTLPESVSSNAVTPASYEPQFSEPSTQSPDPMKDIVEALEMIKPLLDAKGVSAVDRIKIGLQNQDKKEESSKDALSEMLDLEASKQIMIGLLTDRILNPFTSKIDSTTKKLNAKITGKIAVLNTKLYNASEPTIKKVFEKVETQLVALARKKELKIESEIKQVISKVQLETLVQFKNSISSATNKNITQPITNGIMIALANEIKAGIKEKVTTNIDKIANNQLSAVGLNKELNELLQNVSGNLEKKVNYQTIENMITGTASDILSGIDYQKILEAAQDELLNSGLESIAKKYVQDKVFDAVGNKIGKNSGIKASAVGDVKLDLSNLGDKIKNGKIDEIIKIDSIYVKIISKPADIKGFVSIKRDDPSWGNSWRGMLDMHMKTKPEFDIVAEYINGKRQDFSFWYIRVGFQGVKIPVITPIFQLTGAGGVVANRMLIDENKNVKPFAQAGYAVGLKAFFADMATGDGSLYHFDVELMAQFFDEGKYRLSLDGNVSALKDNVTGKTYLAFDNREKECFYGKSNLKLANRLICAESPSEFYFAKDNWYVQLGPSSFRLLCLDWLQGDFSLRVVEGNVLASLGVNLNIDFRSPSIGILKCDAWAYANANAGFRGDCFIQYSPTFGVLNASVRVWANAHVGVGYDCPLKSGNFDFAGIDLEAYAAFRTIPNGNINGRANCSLTVLGCGVDFGMEFNKDL